MEIFFLIPGDVLLSEYEEVLPEAWTKCFSRRTRGYDITTALSQTVNRVAREWGQTSVFTTSARMLVP
jgi:hypothetical protein